MDEYDPYKDLVASNVETMRDFLHTGLIRTRTALQLGDVDLALKTIEAALSFHPMHAESWLGWPTATLKFKDKPAPEAGGREEGNG